MFYSRSEQAKIFPSGSEPPEETIELWMNQRKEEQSHDVMAKVRCLLNQAGHDSSRLIWLVRTLACIHRGDCDHLGLSMERIYRCVNPSCYKDCERKQLPPSQCISHTCTPTETDADNATLQQLRMFKRKADAILDYEDNSAVPFSKLTKMQKRYRLGLYDCISSYCGDLEGEDRKSCIINYCHRSSTLRV